MADIFEATESGSTELDIKFLSGDISKLRDEIVKGVEDRVARVVTDIYNDIQTNSPVDTGFSRANWNISLDDPDFTVHGERNESATYESLPAEVPSNPDLHSVHISNGVPYIGLLEEGESDQAPAGFVAVAVERAASQLGNP
jgi:hypothetical protein